MTEKGFPWYKIKEGEVVDSPYTVSANPRLAPITETRFRIAVTPVPKPRQSQRDKWQQRPAVVAYRRYADVLRIAAEVQQFVFPVAGADLHFALPMPDSWSQKHRRRMDGQPHQQKPDLDNLVKAVMDALHRQDCQIWHITAEKRWAVTGSLTITTLPYPDHG